VDEERGLQVEDVVDVLPHPLRAVGRERLPRAARSGASLS